MDYKSFYILLLLCCGLASASSGDRLPEFQDCVNQCITNTCPRSVGLLKLLAWDCESDCDYTCQQALTDGFEKQRMKLHQFHGKWPFRRFFGIQELASVVFSLLNFFANYLGYFSLKKLPEAEGSYMKQYYIAFSVVGMNTWIWSSIFHVRDLAITEKLDYFSAIGQILFGLFIAILRLLRLDLPENRNRRNFVIIVLAGFYLCHICYLSFIRFNYAYNMLAGVVVGISQTLLWIYLGMRLYVRTGEKMDLLPVFLVLSVMLGMSFELNDFSPCWRILDAHSLWHASTVLPTYFWYKWMSHDIKRYFKKAWLHKERGAKF